MLQATLDLDSKQVFYSGVGFDIYAELEGLVSSINEGPSVFIPTRKSTLTGLNFLFKFKTNFLQQIKQLSGGSFQAIRKLLPEIELLSAVEFPLFIIDIRNQTVFYTISGIDSGELQFNQDIFQTTLGEQHLIEILRHFQRTSHTNTTFRKQIKDAVANGIIENADMTVGDIFGKSCSFLPVDIIASSLGKTDSETSLDDFLLSNTIIVQSNIANFYCKLVS